MNSINVKIALTKSLYERGGTMYNNQLDIFISVADCGSFAKAAEKLYISPTAVMKQMNLLEEHLNLKLLVRNNRGIKLTRAGESIYKDAKYMMSYSQKAIARAYQLMTEEETTICVGTSILNSCNVFMDLWNKVNYKFPNYKINIVPFEDNHNEILSVIDNIGKNFDFMVGVCDSIEWMNRCNFYKLGEYKKCVAVPVKHRLASKKVLKITDLYGETLMMVKRGDSPINDRIRDNILNNHPQIHIEDTASYYDIGVYNRCEQENNVLLNIECWRDTHPLIVTIPVEWDYTIPYGLMYSKNPPKDILEFLDAVKNIKV